MIEAAVSTPSSGSHPATPRFVVVVALVVMVAVALVVMAVAQQGDLLQHEEADQRRQHQAEQRMGVAHRPLEGLGQQVQQRHRQQHAHRQADHVMQVLGKHLVGQPAGDKDGDKATGDGGKQDPEQQNLGDAI
ncbi:hypothetical protein G6F65_021543 [Rhizopus arrhizus]|nr:hypothetical protein G6F65_021543 [Rhizopus arrhizus]